MRSLTVGALACFGLFGLIAHVFLYVVFCGTFIGARVMPSDATIMGSIPSRDGFCKAVIFNQNGGGELASYCIDHLSVVASTVPDTVAWEDQHNVLTAGSGGLVVKRSVIWKSPHDIKVRINLNHGAQIVDHMSLKAFAGHNGDVRIGYSP